MKLHHLKPPAGAKTRKRRVGRGEAGRRGKTAEEITPPALLGAYRSTEVARRTQAGS